MEFIKGKYLLNGIHERKTFLWWLIRSNNGVNAPLYVYKHIPDGDANILNRFKQLKRLNSKFATDTNFPLCKETRMLRHISNSSSARR